MTPQQTNLRKVSVAKLVNYPRVTLGLLLCLFSIKLLHVSDLFARKFRNLISDNADC